MLDNIQKISRTLIQPVKNLCLRIHVKLFKDNGGRKDNFHNLFTIEGNSYLKLDLQSFLTLELTDGEWSRDKSIVIDQRNIYHVIKGFEKSLNAIYHGGIFATNKKGDIVIYSDMVEKHTVRLFNIGPNQRMVIKPAIIYDENEISYEGVVLYINKTANYVELPIDAFEALYYTLKETNIFVYSQLMINYYIAALKEEKVELKQINFVEKPKPKKKHPLLMSNEEKEITEAHIPKQIDEDFFGFNKKN